MKTRALILVSLVLAGFQAIAEPTPLSQIQAEMRNLKFDKAVAIADQAITARDAAADHALFLKATALSPREEVRRRGEGRRSTDRGFPEIRLASQGGLPQSAGLDRAEEVL